MVRLSLGLRSIENKRAPLLSLVSDETSSSKLSSNDFPSWTKLKLSTKPRDKKKQSYLSKRRDLPGVKLRRGIIMSSVDLVLSAKAEAPERGYVSSKSVSGWQSLSNGTGDEGFSPGGGDFGGDKDTFSINDSFSDSNSLDDIHLAANSSIGDPHQTYDCRAIQFVPPAMFDNALFHGGSDSNLSWFTGCSDSDPMLLSISSLPQNETGLAIDERDGKSQDDETTSSIFANFEGVDKAPGKCSCDCPTQRRTSRTSAPPKSDHPVNGKNSRPRIRGTRKPILHALSSLSSSPPSPPETSRHARNGPIRSTGVEVENSCPKKHPSKRNRPSAPTPRPRERQPVKQHQKSKSPPSDRSRDSSTFDGLPGSGTRIVASIIKSECTPPPHRPHRMMGSGAHRPSCQYGQGDSLNRLYSGEHRRRNHKSSRLANARRLHIS